jgi:hypothetical protein
LGSSEPVCELCGNASRTRSADGFLPGTGPVSRVIPTCAPLWPTPQTQNRKSRRAMTPSTDNGRRNGGGQSSPPGLEQAVEIAMGVTPREMDGLPVKCPCRCHTSMSSAAGSPARTSASPAAGPDWPENARVFGGSSLESLGSYDPATSSWRMSQLSLFEDSMSSLRTLPRAGSMRSGTIFQRRPLAPLTGGIASGLLPTPRASPNENRQTKPTPSQLAGRHGMNLATAVHLTKDGLWTTPCADDTGHRKDSYEQGGIALSTQAGGSLNPAWVCWLMGFPPGWVDTGTESPTSDESR